MINEKKKMTAQGSSVGADDGQSISQNSKTTIPDPDEKSNSPGRDLEELYRKMRRMSDPAYLHMNRSNLILNVFLAPYMVGYGLKGHYPFSIHNQQVKGIKFLGR